MNVDRLLYVANQALLLNVEIGELISEAMAAHALAMDLEKLMEYEQLMGKLSQFLKGLALEYSMD